MKLGVGGTPNFIIGGRLYPAALGSDSIKAIVQSLIVFAAKRGVYEATWPSLYGYQQAEHDSLANLVSLLKIISPTAGDGGSSKPK